MNWLVAVLFGSIMLPTACAKIAFVAVGAVIWFIKCHLLSHLLPLKERLPSSGVYTKEAWVIHVPYLVFDVFSSPSPFLYSPDQILSRRLLSPITAMLLSLFLTFQQLVPANGKQNIAAFSLVIPSSLSPRGLPDQVHCLNNCCLDKGIGAEY